MPSAWIERRAPGGATRYRVRYRIGGRESVPHLGGTFKTMREANARKAWVLGELANMRVPRVELLAETPQAPTFATAAAQWQAARVDIAPSTSDQHRIQPAKLTPIIGKRRIDSLTPQDFIDVLATLHGDGVARETIRKTLGAAAMTLDHASVAPNPARDRAIRLPREELEEINP